MEVTRVRNTIMSNPRGILKYCMSFSLQNVIPSSTPMFFYRFNVHDLVEIELGDDLLVIYDFPFTGDRHTVIKNNLDFLVGYFESAGLKDKRFLYDIRAGMPVNYKDFVLMDRLPYNEDGDFAFILDEKEGYVTTTQSVNLFTTSTDISIIDQSILAFFNKSMDVIKPKDKLTEQGGTTSILLSGLFSLLNKEDLRKQIDMAETYAKFFCSISGFHFTSDKVSKLISKLKFDKFKDAIKIRNPRKEDQLLDNAVYLRSIVDIGLDRFVKTIVSKEKPVIVLLDCEWQTIKSMFILDGVAFITPSTMKHPSYFRELLNSDNVELILN